MNDIIIQWTVTALFGLLLPTLVLVIFAFGVFGVIGLVQIPFYIFNKEDRRYIPYPLLSLLISGGTLFICYLLTRIMGDDIIYIKTFITTCFIGVFLMGLLFAWIDKND
jgi:hypothetical protein